MSVYSYQQLIYPARLHREVKAVIAAPLLIGVHYDGGQGQVGIQFDGVLSATDKTVLDGVLAVHEAHESPRFDETVMQMEPTAYWSLNEPPVVARDMGDEASDGVLVGITLQDTNSLLNEGANGYCFNGTSEAIDVSRPALVEEINNIEAGDFTVFMWIESHGDPVNEGNAGTLFTTDTDGPNYYPRFMLSLLGGSNVQPDMPGVIYAFIQDSTGYADIKSDASILGDNQCHFIVLRRKAGTVDLTVDGVIQADTAAAPQVINAVGTRSVVLGAGYLNNQYSSFYKGCMEKVGIATHRALTDSEINELNRAGTKFPKPLLHLCLDEISGTVAKDSTEHATHGAYIGNPTLGSVDSPFVNQPAAVSVLFNGTSQYIDTGTPALTDISGPGAKLSLSAWFKTGTSATAAILTKGLWGPVTCQFELHVNSDGSLAGNIYNAARMNSNVNTNSGSGGDFADSQWHLVVITIDTASDGLIRLYVDGALNVTSTAALADIRSGSGQLLVGAYDDDGIGGFFPGNLTEVKLYMCALSAAEIAELYREREFS